MREERAVEIIGRAFREYNLRPERNRMVRVAKGKQIRLDVAAAEHKYGIAYVTEADATELGDAIPEHPKGTDALVITQGEGGTRILLLFEGDYVQDDLEGEEHTETTIAAAKRIERDAKDFLYKATHDGWP